MTIKRIIIAVEVIVLFVLGWILLNLQVVNIH